MSNFSYTMVTSKWQKATRVKDVSFKYLENGMVRLKYLDFDNETVDVTWNQIQEVLAIHKKQKVLPDDYVAQLVLGNNFSKVQCIALGMFARLVESGNMLIP